MATDKLNDLIKSVSGSIGGLELSRRGEKIIARANPDLAQDWFCIRTVEEMLIETGPAVLDRVSGDRIYRTQTQLVPQQNLVVEATAGDRPAHIGRKILF
jgi:hypothetical protein